MTTVIARLFARVAAMFAAALLSVPAQADWHKAESERFVIYSDSRPDDLAEFAEKLERYHVALSLETGRQVPVPSPSSRLTIYMVGSLDDLRRLAGNRRSSLGGFYMARANGSVAFVPNIRIGGGGRRARGGTRYRRQKGDEVDQSLTVLLHEYAHHFLIGSARHAMPRWLSEGSAEYFASARFNDDGSVDIGLPNNSRAWEISQAAPVSLAELLDYELYRENRGARYDAYYGRAWLLYHYLRFEPSRTGQLPAYWQAVAQGAGSTEAARAIFGDLDRLEKELKQYANQRRMAGMRFAASDIRIESVKVERLSKGHAAMMDVILRSKRDVEEELAAQVVADARAIAARYPDDGEVQAALAEAEYDAGNDNAAIAAADRAIGADPTVANAYVQKGYALFRKAEQADDADAAYAAAMAPFEALNALETDHTQPLIYYYRSFTRRGITPPEDARFAIERATQLAPFDKNLALEVAVMKAGEGQSTIARYLLAPVAADPHGGSRAATARDMIAFLETVPDGRRVAFKDLEVGGDKEGDADEGGDEGD